MRQAGAGFLLASSPGVSIQAGHGIPTTASPRLDLGIWLCRNGVDRSLDMSREAMSWLSSLLLAAPLARIGVHLSMWPSDGAEALHRP